MADVLTSIVPTTEVEAVNAMLAAIGEAPLPADTDLAAATGTDVLLALQILRKTTRDMLTEGWRFNTERGVEILPFDSFTYTTTRGSAVLNTFRPPSGALKWKMTVCRENSGLDLIYRMSKAYRDTSGEMPAPVALLYDRALNRDGALASAYPAVFLDVTWACDFSLLPETARNYAAVRSARLFAAKSMGSTTLVSLTEEEEFAALRALKDDQGEVEQLNLFANPEAFDASGRRRLPSARPGTSVNPGTGTAEPGGSGGTDSTLYYGSLF